MRIARRFICRYKAVSSTHFPDLSLKSTLSRDEQIKTRPIWMPFDPERPYNDLPSLPPSQDVETKTVLKACIEARAVLAELRISGRLIPNPAVLINSIPLLEAQASSEIENIVTTTDRLFRFANQPDAQSDPATKEALRYRTALYHGFQTLKTRPVSTFTAIEVCRTIKG